MKSPGIYNNDLDEFRKMFEELKRMAGERLQMHEF